MTPSPDEFDGLLTSFGFTEMESRLYAELLKRGPATGYALGKALGKATANAYQALNSLVRKGAVNEDDGDPKSFSPVPPAELFAALRGEFSSKAQHAETAFSQIYARSSEQRLYQLRTLTQAVERARAIARDAREILLFDLFPLPFDLLKDELEAAQARGVTVAGLVYGDGDVRFSAVIGPGDSFSGDNWPGLQMSVIADGREVLVALISKDGGNLTQGYWSDSPFIACLHHNGLASELRMAALAPNGGDPLERLSLLSSMPPGLRALQYKSEKES